MAAKADMADEEVSSTNADQVFKFSDAVPAMADVILNGLSYQSLASSIENPSKGPSLRNSRSSSTSSSSERASFFSAYPATASSSSTSSEAFSSPENSLCSGSPHSTATSTSSHSSAKREPASKCIINNDKVKVLVRMRPFFEYEKVCPLRQVLCLLGNKIMVKEHVSNPKGPKSRSFNQLELEVDYVQDDSYVQADQVEKKEEAQRQMYSTIGAPAVHSVLNGQTVTILSYGQAGTGKTYTIYGDGTQEGNGLMPRMASELLQHVKNKCMDQECRVEVSYLEIYQEKLRDLLASSHSKDSSVDLVRMQSPEWSTGSVETSSSGEQDEEMRSISSDSETMASVTSETMRNNDVIKAHVQSPQQVSGFFFGGPSKSSGNYLRLREHPVRGTYVEGLLWKKVSTWSEMDRLLRHGMASRTTAATDTNSHSSRSHTLFTMKITWMTTPGPCGSTASYLNLVDLAGSEKLQNVSMERQNEMKYINKSLSQLNNVILSLSRSTFVSYRNSALTWLLKESLGGNSSTFLVANVSPAEKDFNETLSTLKYAFKAKQIHGFHHQKKDPRRRLIYKMNEDICSIDSLVTSLTKKKVSYGKAFSPKVVAPLSPFTLSILVGS